MTCTQYMIIHQKMLSARDRKKKNYYRRRLRLHVEGCKTCQRRR